MSHESWVMTTTTTTTTIYNTSSSPSSSNSDPSAVSYHLTGLCAVTCSLPVKNSPEKPHPLPIQTAVSSIKSSPPSASNHHLYALPHHVALKWFLARPIESAGIPDSQNGWQILQVYIWDIYIYMIGNAGLRFKSTPVNGSSSSFQNSKSLTAEEFLYGPLIWLMSKD